MIEPIMYLAIGFLVSMLFGLMIVPLVHNRAVRLTTKRLEAATPLSMAEIQADKDQLRAEFAMSARRLEMSVEQLRAKTTSQLAELGKKSDSINRLKFELGEKNAAIFSLEAREKAMKEQLRATEEEFTTKTQLLREAETDLSDKKAELARLEHQLSERSLVAESRQAERATVTTQIGQFEQRGGEAEPRGGSAQRRKGVARTAAGVRARRAHKDAARAAGDPAAGRSVVGQRAHGERGIARAHQRHRRRSRAPCDDAGRPGFADRKDSRDRSRGRRARPGAGGKHQRRGLRHPGAPARAGRCCGIDAAARHARRPHPRLAGAGLARAAGGLSNQRQVLDLSRPGS